MGFAAYRLYRWADMKESLSAEKQTKVMMDIGRRRQRTFVTAFAISWPASFAILLFGLGVGVVLNLIVSSVIAGMLSKMVVRSRRDAIVQSVLKANGISVETFNPTRYIVD